MRKRFLTLVLSFIVIVSMCASAFASAPTPTIDSNGEQGAFASPDTPVSQDKTLVIEKELRAYNADGDAVMAPNISYSYSIAPVTDVTGLTITDAANKHDPEGSVTAPVKAGITGATITSTVAWASTEEIQASATGTPSKKPISIDFSNVVFTGAGVYRYAVTETVTTGYAYDTSGVTASDLAKTRYIDVYVRPHPDNFNNGTNANEWDIYGFTCFLNNESITEDDKTTVAVKTSGFVSGVDDDNEVIPADSYYTFNVTVSKEVVGDAYGALTQWFPFSVIMTNSTITTTVDVKGEVVVDGKADTWTDPSPATFTAGIAGVVRLKSGGSVKYIGIPCGSSVEVYETNIATGVTYRVETTVDEADEPVVDGGVISTSTTPAAVAQDDEKEAYQSTKAVIETSADEADEVSHTVEVKNVFENISPTGVVLRFAPYLLILFGGGLLIAFCLFLFKRTEETEEA